MRAPRLAFALICLALSAPTPAAAQSCEWVNDTIWRAQHTTTQAGLIGLVQGLETAVAQALSMSNELLVSATKVFATQVNTDGQRWQVSKVGANEALAGTLMQQDRNYRIAKIQDDFSSQTGQGVNACGTIQLMQGVASAFEDLPAGATELASLDVDPGSAVAPSEAVRSRLDAVGKVNASVLFEAGSSNADRAAVIQHMAGLPLPKHSPTAGGAENDLMMIRALRVEGLRSPALASLKAVAAFTAPNSHGGGSWPTNINGETGAGTSPMEALDALIDQYGGGSGYEQWSAGLTDQSTRGLMIELTRLRAMSMKLRQEDTTQRGRLTALNAALLALETGGI